MNSLTIINSFTSCDVIIIIRFRAHLDKLERWLTSWQYKRCFKGLMLLYIKASYVDSVFYMQAI